MADRIDDSIPFLMNCVVSAGVEFASSDFSELGLSVQDARILIAVLQKKGIRAGHLSDLTYISQSTLSHNLRRLVAQGLIARERIDEDNRAIAITLTAKGLRVARECEKLSAAHEAVTIRGLDPKTIKSLRLVLKQLLANVSAPLDWEADVSSSKALSGADQ